MYRDFNRYAKMIATAFLLFIILTGSSVWYVQLAALCLAILVSFGDCKDEELVRK